MLKHFFLLFNTVRFLKLKQVFYQFYYRFYKPRHLDVVGAEVRPWDKRWDSPSWQEPSFLGGGNFKFLGKIEHIESVEGWNSIKHSKLWIYNLHYFDDLNAVDANNRRPYQIQLVDSWITTSKLKGGIGWEPYALSLRIVNFIKFFSTLSSEKSPSRYWVDSVGTQAQALLSLLEFHILGNHLFANGKALVFAGAYLANELGDKFLEKGLEIIDIEVNEQFLADGAHFELSPMYHSSLLWDICDLINLAERSGINKLEKRIGYWRKVVKKGLNWLRIMSHPDGKISFFNDSAFGIAPTVKDISVYASRLMIEPNISDAKDLSFCHLKSSGYVVVFLDNRCKALLDVAEVGPTYQPGHAHADTLSFELSIFGQRVFVNSGTSEYGEGKRRHYQRGSKAHNTVVVDNENSSEMWAGFRVGRRAHPQNLNVVKGLGKITVSAEHDGYQKLPGKVIHSRTWDFTGSSLTITDHLSGTFQHSEASFYIHPDASVVALGKKKFQVSLSGGQVILVSFENTEDISLDESTWHPEFGSSVPNKCLVARPRVQSLVTIVEW